MNLHLSGIYLDPFNICHDCHSKPVHERAWSTLDFILSNYTIIDDIFVNIEHSDQVWNNNQEEFQKDFNKLSNRLKINTQLKYDLNINTKAEQRVALFLLTYILSRNIDVSIELVVKLIAMSSSQWTYLDKSSKEILFLRCYKIPIRVIKAENLEVQWLIDLSYCIIQLI